MLSIKRMNVNLHRGQKAILDNFGEAYIKYEESAGTYEMYFANKVRMLWDACEQIERISNPLLLGMFEKTYNETMIELQGIQERWE